VEGRIKEG
jgi:uncharacterized protein YlxW (UPF0749 family)